VSRLAFRVQCNRNDPTDTKISAAGFDFANELFLGPHALRWSTEAEGGAPGGADGGITVGLFLWKPSPNLAEEPNPPVSGNWYEVSALGELYHLRISGKRGPKALNIDNTLTDGWYSASDHPNLTLVSSSTQIPFYYSELSRPLKKQIISPPPSSPTASIK